MSRFFKIFLFTLIIFSFFNDVAEANRNRFHSRVTTPSRLSSGDLTIPEIFGNSNDLVKKPGSFYRAKGEVIVLQGKVTDSFGVPIEGAVIEIWQTNASGKYQNLLETDSTFIDKNFTMSGKAITNNLGNYAFFTIMPGYYANRTPYINLNIYHEEFGKIETEIYFENHPRNKFDAQYLSYSPKERDLLTARVRLRNIFDSESTKVCIFNITMSGVHKYKGF